MHKLEIIGNGRTLNKAAGVLSELDLVGNHQIAVGYGSNFCAVDISLWIGPNGTFAKKSAPYTFLSDETRVQALNVLRRYRIMTANGSLPFGVDGVFGFARNSKNLLALRASSYP
ncbi:MAG: hypothetical protein ACXACI_10960 [Candidatus Hodarchaeales archaeon]|jgi:hypothetical protein